MSDTATLVVSLIDKVTGPAHAQAKALENLERQIKKTGRVGVSYTGKGPVPDVVRRLNRQNLGLLVQSRLVNPLKGKADSAIKATTDGLVNMAKYGSIALGAAGVAAGVYATKATVHMGMFAESTRLAFGLLTGNQAIGENVFKRTIALSGRLGMDVEETAHSMQKLLAMQMAPADAEKWLKLGSDLRSVGVSGLALQRVMLDIAHVKATGKLNMRNLNMFANAGVSSQLLMEEVGKAMGTDEKGALAAMHKGKITAAIALPALERAIMRKTHEHAAGEAGEKFANTTLSGLLGQLKNAPSQFFLRMADASSGSIQELKKFVDQVKSAIGSIDGGDFTRFISNALRMATRLVPLGLEFARGFGDGFGAMVDAMEGLDPTKASLETARDLGHAVADGFKLALDVLKKVADAILWLDQHRNVAAAALGMLAIDRVGGAGTAISGVLGAGKGLFRGVQAARAGSGALGALRAAVGLGTTAATAAGTAATTGAFGSLGGATGAAGAGLGLAGAAAGGAALLGVGAGIAGYAYREEIANWMLGLFGRKDQQTERGLGAPSPTGALTHLASVRPQTNNHVRFESNITIDGKGGDPNEIARNVADQQRGMMEQFFQGAALESGATG